MTPRVTVIIPVRNEAERLPGCLDALAIQDMASADVEVLVVDGGSSDATVEVAHTLLAGRGWARAEVLHSAAGDRSSNLNCGLAAATAPAVVRVDARSRIPAHYLRRCVDLLDDRADLAVVGGRQRAVAAGAGSVGIGVARALNNRWGMGLARYRSGGSSGETDTVYLGAYRTAQLRAAGGWRTDLPVNEDFDLNRRLARFGAVWFDSDLTVDYVPRSSLTALLRQYWAFGLGKARYWRLSGDRPQPRQLVLLGIPIAGLAAFGVVLGVFGTVAGGSVVITGLAAGLLIEAAGADGPRAGLPAHVAALVALGCVAGAWLSGVVVGAVRPVRKPVAGAYPAKQVA